MGLFLLENEKNVIKIKNYDNMNAINTIAFNYSKDYDDNIKDYYFTDENQFKQKLLKSHKNIKILLFNKDFKLNETKYFSFK